MPRRWVVNASPLILLGKIDHISLLTLLTDELVIPRSVVDELREGEETDVARGWVATTGAKLIRPVDLVPTVISGWDLGKGESEVLTWAYEHNEFEAVLDDRAARNCATSLDIPLLGTLGVILLAKKAGHIASAKPLFDDLRSVGIRLSDAAMKRALELAGEL